MSQKCVFLDRDGVLNEDNINYTYQLTRLRILPGVPEALYKLKEAGYLLIIVTNQSGIDQKIYTRQQMEICHIALQEACQHVIDQIYFSPSHQSVSASLTRKPGTLLFEKAIAKFDVDPLKSWMVGDRGRDIVPARLLGIKTIQVGNEVPPEQQADYKAGSLLEATRIILANGGSPKVKAKVGKFEGKSRQEW
jgi:D-glycero-D-manno-heptose 1,7-bisphosphate phosphatase